MVLVQPLSRTFTGEVGESGKFLLASGITCWVELPLIDDVTCECSGIIVVEAPIDLP